jgi:hypothetical protein
MDNGSPPVVVEDEVLADQPSATPPATSPETPPEAAPAPAEPDTLPDFTQPRAPGQLLGSARANQDGLDYLFSLYRKENGHYLMVLTVTNNGSAPIDLNFETNERFDFRVSDAGKLRWNYNNNRFFVQSQQSERIEAGSNNSLTYRADWDGTDNTGNALGKQTYTFNAVLLLTGSPVDLQLEAALE